MIKLKKVCVTITIKGVQFNKMQIPGEAVFALNI